MRPFQGAFSIYFWTYVRYLYCVLCYFTQLFYLGLDQIFFIINTLPLCIFYTREINFIPSFHYIQHYISIGSSSFFFCHHYNWTRIVAARVIVQTGNHTILLVSARRSMHHWDHKSQNLYAISLVVQHFAQEPHSTSRGNAWQAFSGYNRCR